MNTKNKKEIDKQICIIKKMEEIIREKTGTVPTSELLVMCNYCDYLIELLEKQR